MSILEKLKEFLSEPDDQRRMGFARRLFTGDVVRDDPAHSVSGEEFFEDLARRHALADVAFLDHIESLGRCAVLFEARDPQLDQWCRSAWLVQVKDGRIAYIASSTQALPRPPEPGAA